MLKKIIEIIKKNLIPTMLIGALLLSAVCAATYMGGTDLILDLLQAIDTDMRNSGINWVNSFIILLNLIRFVFLMLVSIVNWLGDNVIVFQLIMSKYDFLYRNCILYSWVHENLMWTLSLLSNENQNVNLYLREFDMTSSESFYLLHRSEIVLQSQQIFGIFLNINNVMSSYTDSFNMVSVKPFGLLPDWEWDIFNFTVNSNFGLNYDYNFGNNIQINNDSELRNINRLTYFSYFKNFFIYNHFIETLLEFEPEENPEIFGVYVENSKISKLNFVKPGKFKYFYLKYLGFKQFDSNFEKSIDFSKLKSNWFKYFVKTENATKYVVDIENKKYSKNHLINGLKAWNLITYKFKVWDRSWERKNNPQYVVWKQRDFVIRWKVPQVILTIQKWLKFKRYPYLVGDLYSEYNDRDEIAGIKRILKYQLKKAGKLPYLKMRKYAYLEKYAEITSKKIYRRNSPALKFRGTKLFDLQVESAFTYRKSELEYLQLYTKVKGEKARQYYTNGWFYHKMKMYKQPVLKGVRKHEYDMYLTVYHEKDTVAFNSYFLYKFNYLNKIKVDRLQMKKSKLWSLFNYFNDFLTENEIRLLKSKINAYYYKLAEKDPRLIDWEYLHRVQAARKYAAYVKFREEQYYTIYDGLEEYFREGVNSGATSMINAAKDHDFNFFKKRQAVTNPRGMYIFNKAMGKIDTVQQGKIMRHLMEQTKDNLLKLANYLVRWTYSQRWIFYRWPNIIGFNWTFHDVKTLIPKQRWYTEYRYDLFIDYERVIPGYWMSFNSTNLAIQYFEAYNKFNTVLDWDLLLNTWQGKQITEEYEEVYTNTLEYYSEVKKNLYKEPKKYFYLLDNFFKKNYLTKIYNFYSLEEGILHKNLINNKIKNKNTSLNLTHLKSKNMWKTNLDISYYEFSNKYLTNNSKIKEVNLDLVPGYSNYRNGDVMSTYGVISKTFFWTNLNNIDLKLKQDYFYSSNYAFEELFKYQVSWKIWDLNNMENRLNEFWVGLNKFSKSLFEWKTWNDIYKLDKIKLWYIKYKYIFIIILILILLTIYIILSYIFLIICKSLLPLNNVNLLINSGKDNYTKKNSYLSILYNLDLFQPDDVVEYNMFKSKNAYILKKSFLLKNINYNKILLNNYNLLNYELNVNKAYLKLLSSSRIQWTFKEYNRLSYIFKTADIVIGVFNYLHKSYSLIFTNIGKKVDITKENKDLNIKIPGTFYYYKFINYGLVFLKFFYSIYKDISQYNSDQLVNRDSSKIRPFTTFVWTIFPQTSKFFEFKPLENWTIEWYDEKIDIKNKLLRLRTSEIEKNLKTTKFLVMNEKLEPFSFYEYSYDRMRQENLSLNLFIMELNKKKKNKNKSNKNLKLIEILEQYNNLEFIVKFKQQLASLKDERLSQIKQLSTKINESNYLNEIILKARRYSTVKKTIEEELPLALDILKHDFRKHVLICKLTEIDYARMQMIIKLFNNLLSDDTNEREQVAFMIDVDLHVIDEAWVDFQKQAEEEMELRNFLYKKGKRNVALDLKDEAYYAKIPEYIAYESALTDFYKREIYLETMMDLKAIDHLFVNHKTKWPVLRWFPLIGNKMYYVISIFLNMVNIWKSCFFKIKEKEIFYFKDVLDAFKGSVRKLLLNSYFEKIILDKDYKAFEKQGASMISIFRFLIIWGTFIIVNMSVWFSTFFLIYFILLKLKTLKITINRFSTYLDQKVYVIQIVSFLYSFFKFLKESIQLLFYNIEKKQTFSMQLYIQFYLFCASVQKFVYIVKKSYKAGGLKEVGCYLKLKLKALIDWQKIKFKIMFNISKEDTTLKMKLKKIFSWKQLVNISFKFLKKKNLNFYVKFNLILIRLNFKTLKKMIVSDKLKFLNFILLPLWRKFIKMIAIRKTPEQVEKRLKAFYIRVFFIPLKKFFFEYKIFILSQNWLEFTFFKTCITILKIIFFPITYLVKYQVRKYLENKKIGKLGFYENPMYVILNKPIKNRNRRARRYRKWTSFYYTYKLMYYKFDHVFWLEKYFKYKMETARGNWAYTSAVQNVERFKYFKNNVISWLESIIEPFEHDLHVCSKDDIMKHWPLRRCVFYIFRFNKYKKYLEMDEYEKSVEMALFNLEEEILNMKKKLNRRFFFKSVINHLCFKFFKRVPFKKLICEKKYTKLIFKRKGEFLYQEITMELLDSLFKELPPEFWLLGFLYKINYGLIAKYIYDPDVTNSLENVNNRKEVILDLWKETLKKKTHSREIDKVLGMSRSSVLKKRFSTGGVIAWYSWFLMLAEHLYVKGHFFYHMVKYRPHDFIAKHHAWMMEYMSKDSKSLVKCWIDVKMNSFLFTWTDKQILETAKQELQGLLEKYRINTKLIKNFELIILKKLIVEKYYFRQKTYKIKRKFYWKLVYYLYLNHIWFKELLNDAIKYHHTPYALGWIKDIGRKAYRELGYKKHVHVTKDEYKQCELWFKDIKTYYTIFDDKMERKDPIYFTENPLFMFEKTLKQYDKDIQLLVSALKSNMDTHLLIKDVQLERRNIFSNVEHLNRVRKYKFTFSAVEVLDILDDSEFTSQTLKTWKEVNLNVCEWLLIQPIRLESVNDFTADEKKLVSKLKSLYGDSFHPQLWSVIPARILFDVQKRGKEWNDKLMSKEKQIENSEKDWWFRGLDYIYNDLLNLKEISEYMLAMYLLWTGVWKTYNEMPNKNKNLIKALYDELLTHWVTDHQHYATVTAFFADGLTEYVMVQHSLFYYWRQMDDEDRDLTDERESSFFSIMDNTTDWNLIFQYELRKLDNKHLMVFSPTSYYLVWIGSWIKGKIFYDWLSSISFLGFIFITVFYPDVNLSTLTGVMFFFTLWVQSLYWKWKRKPKMDLLKSQGLVMSGWYYKPVKYPVPFYKLWLMSEKEKQIFNSIYLNSMLVPEVRFHYSRYMSTIWDITDFMPWIWWIGREYDYNRWRVADYKQYVWKFFEFRRIGKGERVEVRLDLSIPHRLNKLEIYQPKYQLQRLYSGVHDLTMNYLNFYRSLRGQNLYWYMDPAELRQTVPMHKPKTYKVREVVNWAVLDHESTYVRITPCKIKIIWNHPFIDKYLFDNNKIYRKAQDLYGKDVMGSRSLQEFFLPGRQGIDQMVKEDLYRYRYGEELRNSKVQWEYFLMKKKQIPIMVKNPNFELFNETLKEIREDQILHSMTKDYFGKMHFYFLKTKYLKFKQKCGLSLNFEDKVYLNQMMKYQLESRYIWLNIEILKIKVKRLFTMPEVIIKVWNFFKELYEATFLTDFIYINYYIEFKFYLYSTYKYTNFQIISDLLVDLRLFLLDLPNYIMITQEKIYWILMQFYLKYWELNIKILDIIIEFVKKFF